MLQVLSMSRLGGAGAVAPLVTDIPISSVEVLFNYNNKLIRLLFLQNCPTYHLILYPFLWLVLFRKRAVKLEITNQPGKSGQVMVQKGKWPNLWKKMLVLQCNFFSLKHYVLCLFLLHQQFTTLNHQIHQVLLSQKLILLLRDPKLVRTLNRLEHYGYFKKK